MQLCIDNFEENQVSIQYQQDNKESNFSRVDIVAKFNENFYSLNTE